ncbi:MAG: hemolysin III family protein [Treponema sp.]|jgi:hemolysin III|nr:hemolysin III family protein [Treponema sp.]
MEVTHPSQTLGEEIANSTLHGIGVLLGVAGLVLLAFQAPSSPSALIFAGAMILMFLASTLYHALIPPRVKALFRIFDHQAIYLFIAGTYTPYCLLGFKGTLGWVFFGFEWALALGGIVLSALRCRFLKKIEMAIFILMGWAILAGSIPLARSLSLKSLVLLFAGGAAYTAGTFWYRAGKRVVRKGAVSPEGTSPLSSPGLPGAHVVWHLFVLAGAVCHWFSIWFLCRTA